MEPVQIDLDTRTSLEKSARELLVQPQTAALISTDDPPLVLELGGHLREVTVAYETYGTLSARRDNAVLVCHALTGDAHAAGKHHPEDPKSGWWNEAIGPGKPIDTNRYFVICSNVLGSRYGSTGPNSINPETGEVFGLEFPLVTVRDMVAVQRKLIEQLGIEQLHAVLGGSLGGMQALAWLEADPRSVRRVIPICSGTRLTAQAHALNAIGRRAILAELDRPSTTHAPKSGLGIARMLAHVSYLSDLGMDQRFQRRASEFGGPLSKFDQGFPVETYLDHQATVFTDRFDEYTYLYLTHAMDHCDIKLDQAYIGEAGGNVQVSCLSYDTDWLYPPRQAEEVCEALTALGVSCTHHVARSDAGHDGFLVDVEAMEGPLRAALG